MDELNRLAKLLIEKETVDRAMFLECVNGEEADDDGREGIGQVGESDD